jgi:ABC-type siderophore export system fused ATPase/permease subunit
LLSLGFLDEEDNFYCGVYLISIAAVTWLYLEIFNPQKTQAKLYLKLYPADASLLNIKRGFFYDIFNDFTLFEDVLGKKVKSTNLNALKVEFL